MTDFVGLHQNLYRSMAICGYIETSFRILVDICEDDHEEDTRRRGAQFWANQIATGFILFKEVKRLFKAKKDKVCCCGSYAYTTKMSLSQFSEQRLHHRFGPCQHGHNDQRDSQHLQGYGCQLQ